VTVSQDRHLFVIADDSGLEVDALDGAPGITPRVMPGENASDEQNIDKTLAGTRRSKRCGAERSARFVASSRWHVMASSSKLRRIAEGTIVDLRAARADLATSNFQANGLDKTLANYRPRLRTDQSSGEAIAALRQALFDLKPKI